MWDESLIESKGRGKLGKTWFTFPIALLIHALVIGVLIWTSYWTVEAVQTPPLTKTVIFIGEKPHGGDPAGPIARPKPPKTATSHLPISQPPQISETLTQQTPDASAEPNQNATSNNIEGKPGGGPEGTPGGDPDATGVGTGFLPGTESDKPIIITPDVTLPVLIRKITPDYPRIAINARIQGVVFLEAVITRTGTVEELRVLHSPHPLLEQAAVKAVKQWLYRPALVNGRPVKVYFNVTVEFKIE